MNGLCLRCRNADAASSEHVVLNVFGGRRVVTGIWCRTCNAHFGSTIDRAVFDEFHALLAVTRCRRGDGHPVPPYRGARTADGHQVVLRADRGAEVQDRPAVVAPVPIDPFATADLAIHARDPEHAAVLLHGQTQRIGRALAEVSVEVGQQSQFDPVPVDLRFKFGSPKSHLGVLKMGLVSLQAHAKYMGTSWEIPSQLVAVLDSSLAPSEHHRIDLRSARLLRSVGPVVANAHKLLVWNDPDDGTLQIAFVAFGLIPIRAAYPRSGPPLDVVLVDTVDPYYRTHHYTAVHRALRLPPLRTVTVGDAVHRRTRRALFELIAEREQLGTLHEAAQTALDLLRYYGHSVPSPASAFVVASVVAERVMSPNTSAARLMRMQLPLVWAALQRLQRDDQ
ncbi:MAG: hypothetical protein H6742_18355 [Alphaproteobacteria bacterium]|nr:hypothetical protein [Alphaproteobacteria bacterium]